MSETITEREREEWPADRGTGGFSKPASKVMPTIDEAIAVCNCPTYGGDFIVKLVTDPDGYQVWMRRANARGASHPTDYEWEPTGRRAKKHAAGSGRLFILDSPTSPAADDEIMNKTKTWEEVATETTGAAGNYTTFRLYRRTDRWQVTVSAAYSDTEGRGDSPEEACEAVRRDVFAWCRDDEWQRAEYATALRKLCYAAEDAE